MAKKEEVKKEVAKKDASKSICAKCGASREEYKDGLCMNCYGALK